MLILSLTPWRAALRRATSSAAGEISVATICACGNSRGQRHSDAAGACAHVGDTQRRVAPLAQPLQRYFDQVLGFGARDQHAGIDLESQAPELLLPGQVLHRDAIGAAFEQIVILGELVQS